MPRHILVAELNSLMIYVEKIPNSEQRIVNYCRGDCTITSRDAIIE